MSVREAIAGYVIEQDSPDFVIEATDEDVTRITFEGGTETVIVRLSNDEAIGLMEELSEHLAGGRQ